MSRCPYTRGKRFPTLHVVPAGQAGHLRDNLLKALATAARGITIAVLVTTSLRLQRGEPWYEAGVDGRTAAARYREPAGH